MNILLIARGCPSKIYPQWGCFEKDQAEALAAYGHKVVVMSVDARFKRHRGMLGLHRFQCNGVCYYNYVMLPAKIFSQIVGKYWRRIRLFYTEKIFKKIIHDHGNPDIIYSHFFGNTYVAVFLKEKYHIPVVGIEHLGRFNESVLPKETERLASYAFPRADAMIAVSKKLGENIKKRFHIDCAVVNNMYGQEFLNPQIISSTSLQKQKIVFVSVARIDYKKGFDILINALKKANLPQNAWALKIIGWGDEVENLKKLIISNNLQANISFLGKKSKDEIVQELRYSDVFVLASRLETFGIVYIEAMSQGLPVIGTICGGPEEIINSSNGILVPSDDVDAMAAAIIKMVETYSQYDRNQIAEYCKKQYSPEAIAGKLTEVFETVLNKKSNGL